MVAVDSSGTQGQGFNYLKNAKGACVQPHLSRLCNHRSCNLTDVHRKRSAVRRSRSARIVDRGLVHVVTGSIVARQLQA
jgi:hypothetical protein